MHLSTASSLQLSGYYGTAVYLLSADVHCDVQVSIEGHHTDTAVGLETSSFYRGFYRTTSTYFISLDSVNSVVPGTHAQQLYDNTQL